jgi:hypothetical protein
MGNPPSHGELLDSLAVALVDGGWDLKSLHREMVVSAVYRQGSRLSTPGWSDDQRSAAARIWKAAARVDGENRLLWRMRRRRLEGEAIRDAMLAAAGRLSTRRGGPGVMPPLPADLTRNLLKDHWQVSPDPEDHHRRSIYLFARRNLRYPVFEAFDRPEANASCPSRHRSTTAIQSLLLSNSLEALRFSQALAGRGLAEAAAPPDAAGDLAGRAAARCFLLALGRPLSGEEARQAGDFLARQAQRLAQRPLETLVLPTPHSAALDPAQSAALVDLCLAFFNLSEFVYAD